MQVLGLYRPRPLVSPDLRPDAMVYRAWWGPGNGAGTAAHHV